MISTKLTEYEEVFEPILNGFGLPYSPGHDEKSEIVSLMSQIHASLMSTSQNPLVIISRHSVPYAFLCSFDSVNGVFVAIFDIFHGALISASHFFQGVVKVLFGIVSSIHAVVNGR